MEGLEFGSLQGIRELDCESAKHMRSNVLTIIDNLGGLGLEGGRGVGTARWGKWAPVACSPGGPLPTVPAPRDLT